jgi:hypothetical protein
MNSAETNAAQVLRGIKLLRRHTGILILQVVQWPFGWIFWQIERQIAHRQDRLDNET